MRKFILLLSLFSPALAQELILEPIEVEASREVLKETTVRELPAKDVGEALEYRIPGIWKIRKGGIANDIVIRGFKKDEVNFLVEGARLYNACPNRMDPGLFHIDFAEVKEVKVIKGPFDVKNYGALGGTVEVKTKDPKEGFSGTLNVAADNWKYFNPSLTLSYGKDRFGFLLGYAFRFSKPYEDGKGRKFTEIPTAGNAYSPDEINSTAFNIHTVWTKFFYKITPNVKLKLSYAHQKANDVLYPYLMMDGILDETDRVNLTLEGRRFKAQLYHSSVRHWMDNRKRVKAQNSGSPTGWNMQTYAVNKVYGFKGEYRIFPNLNVGIDTFLRNWDAITTMYMKGTFPSQNTIPDVDFTIFGIFGEYKKKLTDRLKLYVGARVDYAKTEADPAKANTDLYLLYHGTADLSQTDVLPSGNIQLTYELSKKVELFAGLGSAARIPDPQERYFALKRMKGADWVGNPNLDPERNTELDLGAKLTTGRISLQGRTFFSYVSNYIYIHKKIVGTNQATTYTNIDAYFYGLELSGTYALTDTLFFDGNLAYTRARKKDTYPEKNIYDKDIAEIPPLTARLALRYDTGTYFGELEGILTATQNNVDSDLQETKTSGYGILNLKAGMNYKGLRLTAGINNLFDKLYYTHLSYLRNPFNAGVKIPEPGRTFYLNVAYTF
ncbi:TonB-dependent receptor [Aquifex sp.]